MWFCLQVVIEEILDLDTAVTHSSDFLQFISGGRLLPGSVPLAHRYGGHQVNTVLDLVQFRITLPNVLNTF